MSYTVTVTSQQFYAVEAAAAESEPHPVEQLRAIGERYKANQDEFSKQLQGWIAQLVNVSAAELEKQAPQLFHNLIHIILTQPLEATKHPFAREVLHCIAPVLPRTNDDKLALIPASQAAGVASLPVIEKFIELAQRVAKTIANEAKLLALQQATAGNRAIIAKTQATIEGIKQQAKEQRDTHKKDTEKKLEQQAAGMKKVADAFQVQLSAVQDTLAAAKAETAAARAETAATNTTNAQLQQQISSLQAQFAASRGKKGRCVIC